MSDAPQREQLETLREYQRRVEAQIMNPYLEQEILAGSGVNVDELMDRIFSHPTPSKNNRDSELMEKHRQSTAEGPTSSKTPVSFNDFQIPEMNVHESSQNSPSPSSSYSTKIQSINKGSSILSNDGLPSYSFLLKNSKFSQPQNDLLNKTRDLIYISDGTAGAKAAPTIIDLVFLVDCTGSMTTLIETVRDELGNIMKSIKEDVKYQTARFAFVGYRDFCDGAENYVIKDFTENEAEMKTFIASIEAKGGGDAAEDVVGGYYQALYGLNWYKGSHKNIVHFFDASAHGTGWNSGIGDDYADANKIVKVESRPDKMKDYVARIYERTIYLIVVQLDPARTAQTVDNIQNLFNRHNIGHRFQKREAGQDYITWIHRIINPVPDKWMREDLAHLD
ncbi:hypothetical protein HK098_002961 [Nowakowskiella sp. JEL0407]|nr:hypothetical protein HK098_002961 [Nowakowskiella sp. JEL0407]